MQKLISFIDAVSQRIRAEEIGAPSLWQLHQHKMFTVNRTPGLVESVEDAFSLYADSMRATGSSWLEQVSDPLSFEEYGSENDPSQWSLFWALVQAEHDLLRTFSRARVYEEPHNAAFFAHLSTAMWTHGILGEGQVGGQLFWADCKRKNIERSNGGDFIVAIAIDEDRLKVALFQAKTSSDQSADIGYKPRTSEETQLQILQKSDRDQKHRVPNTYRPA
ncbi:hypothetical protein ATU3C_25155 [Agrobacterium genomosp. 3 str. RTP8]|uniref:hypothetical protein n=1 Tax=Agrobacterium tomkonis TaxID=1183410 RepID=UPI001CD9C2EF|nr:hypothetical protein [Agrobacterium tomkonis RTP8]